MTKSVEMCAKELYGSRAPAYSASAVGFQAYTEYPVANLKQKNETAPVSGQFPIQRAPLRVVVKVRLR
jgi:hypothetical protein